MSFSVFTEGGFPPPYLVEEGTGSSATSGETPLSGSIARRRRAAPVPGSGGFLSNPRPPLQQGLPFLYYDSLGKPQGRDTPRALCPSPTPLKVRWSLTWPLNYDGSSSPSIPSGEAGGLRQQRHPLRTSPYRCHHWPRPRRS
ncbi:hypothetical protein HPP92_028140 [Vanilla planifolia]|uniref:Uncharacterized protein n=1 Tax=Vanilla planifolia TaxID=51239 RepID=A0A835P8F9_VANPL|nr:hypothetical protein HPP92_028140 [Vanilla planifolia]KAG0447894.1 hypothetical protein HPP92_028119 [Vanilla planifolia]